MKDRLSEVLNIGPIESTTIKQHNVVIVPEGDDIEEKINFDYETARANLHSILAQGQAAVQDALLIATSSESPRAFEVLGALMKHVADINHQLLDLSEKRQKLINQAANDEDKNPKNITNNAIFFGSTLELKKVLNKIANTQ